jgi:uncharacterized repeat protein (TIGR04052 family)
MVDIPFVAKIGNQVVECGTNRVYSNLGKGNAGSIEIADFRLYLYDIALVDRDGKTRPLVLKQNAWQNDNLVLLDFENAQGLCSNNNAITNTTIEGEVPKGDYVGLQFMLGVPATKNHQNNATAASPLNIPSLFWSWQTGYKFLRLDMKTNRPPRDAADKQFWFIHLGSTGCVGDDKNQAPTSPCTNPNVPKIYLDYKLGQKVVIDVEGLLKDVDLEVSTPMPDGCMSGVSDPDCPDIFKNLGLSLTTGKCENDCRDQKMFRVE